MSTTPTLVPTERHAPSGAASPVSRTAPDPVRARPADSPILRVDDSIMSWTLIDLERYEVRRAGAIVGYVDVVGHVFVALVGLRYDRATEVAQTLTFRTAIEIVAAVADE